jgi:hypothetical protein
MSDNLRPYKNYGSWNCKLTILRSLGTGTFFSHTTRRIRPPLTTPADGKMQKKERT